MKKGIDVSTLQGEIDWSGVDADFAMLKATQGRGETRATEKLRVFTDSKFRRNVTAASERGIALGCYHYFTAADDDEALYEAEHFCRVIEPYHSKLKLWAAVDVESERWLAGVGKKKLTSAVSAFTEFVKNAGFRPMIYTNPDFIRHRFDALPDADVWLAHWNVRRPMSVDRLKLWQYGLENVDGIGLCDVNYGWFDDVVPADASKALRVGESYTLKPGDVYSNGKAIPQRLVGKSFPIKQVKSDRVLLSVINSWVMI